MSAPAVAVSPDGKRFAAAWKDVREGSPRVWWAFAAEPRFVKEGPIAEEPRVERNHPSLAADDRGEFWAAWEEERGGAAWIRARSSATRESARDVADASQGTPAFPVTACGAGLAVVAWEETPKAGTGRVLFRVLEDSRR